MKHGGRTKDEHGNKRRYQAYVFIDLLRGMCGSVTVYIGTTGTIGNA